MNARDFYTALDQRAAQDSQTTRDQAQAKVISDAIVTALQPHLGTSKQPEIRIAKLPDVQANVDHTPVLAALDQVRKSIQTLNVRPNIKVGVPDVTVPPLDVTPITKAISQLKPVPKFDLSSYKAQDLDELEQGVQYVGFVNPDGEWYIIQNKEELNQIRYAFGKTGYPAVWPQASKLTYKLLNEAVNEVQT